MLLLRTSTLPDGDDWEYELKLDGYRALAIKTGAKVHLRSRNNNDFNVKYPAVVEALAGLPDETVLDGEMVAFDHSGRPSFNRSELWDLAKQWRLGRETVRLLVKDEPDVVKIRMGRRRLMTRYSVPESVARRVHIRLFNPAA